MFPVGSGVRRWDYERREPDADRMAGFSGGLSTNEETITALKAMVPMWFSPLRRAGITIRWRRKTSADICRAISSTEKILLRAASAAGRALGQAGKGVPPMRFAELLAGSELMRRYVQK